MASMIHQHTLPRVHSVVRQCRTGGQSRDRDVEESIGIIRTEVDDEGNDRNDRPAGRIGARRADGAGVDEVDGAYGTNHEPRTK